MEFSFIQFYFYDVVNENGILCQKRSYFRIYHVCWNWARQADV